MARALVVVLVLIFVVAAFLAGRLTAPGATWPWPTTKSDIEGVSIGMTFEEAWRAAASRSYQCVEGTGQRAFFKCSKDRAKIAVWFSAGKSFLIGLTDHVTPEAQTYVDDAVKGYGAISEYKADVCQSQLRRFIGGVGYDPNDYWSAAGSSGSYYSSSSAGNSSRLDGLRCFNRADDLMIALRASGNEFNMALFDRYLDTPPHAPPIYR